MKKTLLAAALLAGFAGVAQAETQVTLYGIIDEGIAYNKIDGANGGPSHSKVGIVSGVQSGSRWGLRGTEDLGGGLQAVFQLESGFNANNGTSAQGGRLFGRHATIGLQNASWGRFDLGRQTNISSKYLANADPFGAGFGAGVGGNFGYSFGFADTARYDNMALYQTPVISGFQLGVGYTFNNDQVAFGDAAATTDNARGITAGLKYSSGPLYVALTYEQRNAPHNLDEPATPRAYGIGAAYDFEVVKLHAAYARTNDISPAGAGNWAGAGYNDGAKYNSYLVGVTVPVGSATSIMASWQAIDPKDNPGGDDETQHAFSLGATYSLSKRTNLYAYGAFAKNVGFEDGRDGRTVVAGIRHQF